MATLKWFCEGLFWLKDRLHLVVLRGFDVLCCLPWVGGFYK